jgi:AraC-like DNA-binding protein
VNPVGQADGAASDYREFRAPLPLAEHVFCFWTQAIGSHGEFAQRVLPDGCVDFILMNGVPMVIGPWTGAYVAALAPGTKIIGARCHPGAASSLLGMPASELLNQSVPLCDVWSRANADRFARIAGEPSLAAQFLSMEAALLGRVNGAGPVDKATRAAIRWIARHPHGRIEQLSELLGLSGRQVQRRFTMAVGYGPKLFQSVLRFQRLLNLAAVAEDGWNLAGIAADAEYADQAHMTREVQRFSGDSPGASLKSSRCALRLSSLIQDADGPGH